MSTYTGQRCPVCNKPLQDGEPIAVCPDCGTPHHRDCFFENGHCANSDKHGTGFEWENPDQKAREKAQDNTGTADRGQPYGGSAPGTNECPDCHAQNPPGASFCINCGSPITSAQQTNVYGGPGFNPLASQQNSRYGGANPEDTIDGIKVKDMAEFIGPSAGYYLFQFTNMDRRGKKVAFSFSSFFFTPIYMLYRKVWHMAIITFLANFVLSLPTYILLFSTEEQFASLMSGNNMFYLIYMLCGALTLAYRVFFGLFGLRIYRKTIVRRMNKLAVQAESSGENATALYRKKGGVSRKALIVLATFYLLGYFVLTWMTYTGMIV